MKILSTLFLLLFTAAVFSQEGLIGSWAGATNVLGSFRVVQVRFDKSSGTVNGSMDIPGANAMRLPLKNIMLNGEQVSFTIETPRGRFSFSGNMNNNKVTGTITDPFNTSGTLYFTKSFEIDDALLKSYAGKYTLSNGQIAYISYNSLNSLDMALVDEATTAALRDVKIFPSSNTRFITARTLLSKPGTVTETVQFTLDQNNLPTGFTLADSEGKEVSATKVETNYTEEQVIINNGNIQFGGTLFLPKGKKNLTAIYSMHGAGPRIRTNILVMLRARLLAESYGIAVLVCDKRGVASENGSDKQPTFTDLASDANASVSYLKKRPEINPAKIGIMAPSHAGWAFPIAAQVGLATFGIVVSGSPLNNEIVSTYEIETQLRNNKFSESDIQEALAFTKLKWQYALTGKGWAEYEQALQKAAPSKWFNLAEGPADNDKEHWERMELCVREDRSIEQEIKKIKIPVLLLFGEDKIDDRVPVNASIAEWQRIISTMPNSDFTIKQIPGTGHSVFFKTSNGRVIRANETFEVLNVWMKAKKL